MKHTSWMIGTGLLLLFSASLSVAQGSAGAQTSNVVQAANANQSTNAIKDTSPASPAPPVQPAPLEPSSTGEPHTEMLDSANAPEGHDPLLEPKPLPKANLSLIGGVARKVDTIHNRFTLQPFGGGTRYVIYFDERTRIMSGGRETTSTAIHPGDRVYVDSQALGAHVFARLIQVRSVSGPAQASGQVIEVLGGQVRLQDRLSGETIRFQLSDHTRIESQGKPSSASLLHSGSLIDVTFTPGGRRNEAQSITIHATPGESYVFAGVLTNVDIRDGVIALDNQTDGNNYELYFDPLSEKDVNRLVIGVPVHVVASFDGKRYRATSINITEVMPDSETSNR